MSWMDSWSRPSKSQATPPPLYLTHGDSVPYCHTCGRVIGSRRTNSSKQSATQVKYCSDKCKKHKPSTAPESLDCKIQDALLALLQGHEVVSIDETSPDTSEHVRRRPVRPKQAPKKGDTRIIVQLSELETAIFGDRTDPEKVYGRRKNRRARFVPEKGECKSVDMQDDSQTDHTATSNSETDDDETVAGVRVKERVRPPQSQSDVNFSAAGGERGWAEKIEESPEMLAKRQEGQKRAEEKELVKSAARRAVAFGLLVDAPASPIDAKRKTKKEKMEAENEVLQETKVMRKCEALMNGQVVEPSFAKGDWSIRWRDD